MSQSLEDLLEEARRVGTVESAGTFTMDFQAAIEKLRGFQIENQYHYVNRLVRSATLAGAGVVRVTTNAHKTRVHFPALACEPQALPNLFEEIFQNARPAARELASSVNLALALKPARLEIQVCNDERGRMMVLENGTGDLFDAHGVRGTTFQLTRSRGSAASHWGADSPEYLAITKRFRYSPLHVEINGKTMEGRERWGAPRAGTGPETVHMKDRFWSSGERFMARHHAVEMRVYHEDPHANCLGLGPSRASGLVTVDGQFRPAGPERCYLALGLCADPKSPSTATFVYEGEMLQRFPVRLPIPAVEFLVSAHDLPLDLSGEQLRQGEEFERRWAEAKSWFEPILTALREAYPGHTGHQLTRQALFDKTGRWQESFAAGSSVRLHKIPLREEE